MHPTEYDYVIAGAGSAGCALAHRLSEDPDARVLLIEAGPRDYNWQIHIPAGFPKLFKTKLDWEYYTEEEAGCHGRKLYWPRGRVLGGSSSINAMVYIRGHRRDYDRWRDLGNAGWGWDDVLPYFKRSQHQERGPSDLHGTGGPLNVTEQLEPNPLSRAFVAAGEEIGWAPIDDFNGPRQEGVGLYQVTQKDGRRCSSATAFLRPIRRRPNLTVWTQAPVQKVLMDGTRAVGVEILDGRQRHEIRAKREVILCGGAVGSPQMLMLSGIGPADHLREHGVPVMVDLPGVGGNLQDHLLLSVVYRTLEDVTLDNVETLGNLVRYYWKRRGPYTSSVCEAGAFVRTTPDRELPDLQFHFLPTAIVEHGFEEPTDHGVNFGPTLLRPRSVGSIRLRSADPADPPRIAANYLQDSADAEVLVEGVRLSRRLAASRAFEPYFDREILPGPGIESEEDLVDFVRRTAQTLYHPVGTCRMGNDPGDDRPAVVDDRLCVHGVEGLRVADASVMPEIIGGNTNAPAIMIAEKAADLVRGAHA